jgi:hypothetical protein
MTQIKGPFDQGDFRTMQMLKQNVKWYKTKDQEMYGDVVRQHQENLKGFFRKVV